MIQIKKFTFNPFQENTYLLFDDTKECLIVDPGCFNSSERKELDEYIANNGLKPVKLLNTHAHIDHVLGNRHVAEKYNLGVELYKSSRDMLRIALTSSKLYGVPYEESPEPSNYLEEGDQIKWGNSTLDILHVPGHSPDHVVFLNAEQKIMIGGDVLFKGSIGRTDLPGGDHQQLLDNIRTKIFTLDEAIKVYSGHGDETTIGVEMRTNPFF